jgi:hypothetical protein
VGGVAHDLFGIVTSGAGSVVYLYPEAS